MTETAKVVVDTVLAVVRLRAPEAASVRLEHELADDLNLASLDLAELGARIEVELGQPVFDGVAMQGFVTVGDLVAHCEAAMAGVGG